MISQKRRFLGAFFHRFLILGLMAALFSTPAPAIVTRHDVEDKEYQTSPTDYPGIFGLNKGPGDSGGPAFIEKEGRLLLAGISSHQLTGGRPEGSYGVRERYTRVSSAVEWIEEMISGETGEPD